MYQILLHKNILAVYIYIYIYDTNQIIFLLDKQTFNERT